MNLDLETVYALCCDQPLAKCNCGDVESDELAGLRGHDPDVASDARVAQGSARMGAKRLDIETERKGY